MKIPVNTGGIYAYLCYASRHFLPIYIQFFLYQFIFLCGISIPIRKIV